MREVGSLDLSLSELARRSYVSKPNIYRYFESREQVLLDVWVEEIAELTTNLEASLADVAPGDVGGVVAAIVAAFNAQPLMCELTSICSPVLERKVSVDPIVSAMRTLATLSLKLAELLHDRLPSISLQDCTWIAGTTATFVAGLWPAANPGKVADDAYSRSELAGTKPMFARDLTRFLEVLLAGLGGRQ